jgi:glutaredoxin
MSRKRPKMRDAEIEDDSILENTKIQEKEQKEFFKKTKNQLAAVAGAFFVIGFLVSTLVAPSMTGYSIGTGANGALANGALSADDVGDKVIEQLNSYLLMDGYDAEVTSAEEASGMVVVDVKITSGDQSQDVTFFASSDGRYLFLSAPADMDSPPEQQEEEVETAGEYPKSDTPNVKMFVMSFCPYGQQAEDGLGPAMEAIGEYVDFEPHFVIYESYGDNGANYCMEDESGRYCSMHGINELREDIRQAVVWNYYPDKWWAYVNKVNADCSSSNVETCWKGAAEAAGLDVADIEAKFESDKFQILASEYALDVEYGVRGSPSIFVNDVKYAGARSPESFKSEICSAFNTPPEACGETLEGGTASSSGSC